jgi:HD-GYP domain-containing protein (c-di-GMP phosphodiesterase class II)
MAVPDAFSAMTTDRPYRKGLTVEEAIGRLREGVGTQFDPAVVVAFIRALGARNGAKGERRELVGAGSGSASGKTTWVG